MSEAGVERRRRSRSEVATLVAEFEASGLTRQAFCKERGLSVGTLDKYRRRAQKVQSSSNGALLPVEVVWSGRSASDPRGDSVLVVEVRSGHRIEVRRGFDGGTLEHLLKILDRM